MMWTNHVADGPSHSFKNVPVILWGNAGGYLKQGQYVDAANSGNNKLLNTLISAAIKDTGPSVEDFGEGTGGQLDAIRAWMRIVVNHRACLIAGVLSLVVGCSSDEPQHGSADAGGVPPGMSPSPANQSDASAGGTGAGAGGSGGTKGTGMLTGAGGSAGIGSGGSSAGSGGLGSGGTAGGTGGSSADASVSTGGMDGGSSSGHVPVPSAGCSKAMGRPADGVVAVAQSHYFAFPESYDGTQPFPLLVGFHGCGAATAAHQRRHRVDELHEGQRVRDGLRADGSCSPRTPEAVGTTARTSLRVTQATTTCWRTTASIRAACSPPVTARVRSSWCRS